MAPWGLAWGSHTVSSASFYWSKQLTKPAQIQEVRSGLHFWVRWTGKNVWPFLIHLSSYNNRLKTQQSHRHNSKEVILIWNVIFMFFWKYNMFGSKFYRMRSGRRGIDNFVLTLAFILGSHFSWLLLDTRTHTPINKHLQAYCGFLALSLFKRTRKIIFIIWMGRSQWKASLNYFNLK